MGSALTAEQAASQYPVIDLEQCWSVTAIDYQEGAAEVEGLGTHKFVYWEPADDIKKASDIRLPQIALVDALAHVVAYDFIGNDAYSTNLARLEGLEAFVADNQAACLALDAVRGILTADREANFKKQATQLNTWLKTEGAAAKIAFWSTHAPERPHYVARLHELYIGPERVADEYTDDECRHTLDVGVIASGKDGRLGRLSSRVGNLMLCFEAED
jgi:hypothetical protein